MARVVPAHATDQGRSLVLDQGEDALAVGGGAGELLLPALLRDLPVEIAAGLDGQGDRGVGGRLGIPGPGDRRALRRGRVGRGRGGRGSGWAATLVVSLGGSSCRSSFAERVSPGFSATTCLRTLTAASVWPWVR